MLVLNEMPETSALEGIFTLLLFVKSLLKLVKLKDF